MNTFLMMFSMKELIIAGAILAVVILAVIIGIAVSSGKRKNEIRALEKEADLYCDLFYNQVAKTAEVKYKAYVAKGYQDKLPNPVDAIGKDKEMKDQLDQTVLASKRKAVWEQYLPNIMLALVRCKAEGLDAIPKKEAVQLKKLMREYGIMSKEAEKK